MKFERKQDRHNRIIIKIKNETLIIFQKQEISDLDFFE